MRMSTTLCDNNITLAILQIIDGHEWVVGIVPKFMLFGASAIQGKIKTC